MLSTQPPIPTKLLMISTTKELPFSPEMLINWNPSLLEALDKTPSSGQAIEIKMIVGSTTYTYRYTFGNLIVNATNTKSSGWSLALELSGSGTLVLNINDVLDIQIATSSGNLQNSEVQLDCLFSYDITDGFF